MFIFRRIRTRGELAQLQSPVRKYDDSQDSQKRRALNINLRLCTLRFASPSRMFQSQCLSHSVVMQILPVQTACHSIVG